MTDLNALTNIAATYPNVFVEGSEIYLGSNGSPKRIKLYPVTFEWFDGDLTKLDWTERQFVDAYLSELSQHLDFIEMFINGEFPVKQEHWQKLCDVVNDCFLRSCAWDALKSREYEFLMSRTYRIESDGRIYRNDLYPHTPIISDTIRLQEYFGWMFSPIEKGNDLRSLVVTHNAKCAGEQPLTEEHYASIGEKIADTIIYSYVKLDICPGLDWDWVSDQIFDLDPTLGEIVAYHLHPMANSSPETVIPDEITLETAL